MNCVERSGQWECSFKTFKLFGDFVTNTNKVPVAKAASSINGGVVTLDASASTDGDSDALSYKWEQITGPTFVTITDADKAKATISGAPAGSYYFKLTADDAKDIDFTILNVVVADGSGIENDVIDWTKLSVYPNPVKDELFFQYSELDKIKRVDVYNVSGMFVASKAFSNGSISLKNLTEGIYYLSVYSENEKIGDVKVLKSAH